MYVKEAYRLLQKSIIFVEADDIELEENEEVSEMILVIRICVYNLFQSIIKIFFLSLPMLVYYYYHHYHCYYCHYHYYYYYYYHHYYCCCYYYCCYYYYHYHYYYYCCYCYYHCFYYYHFFFTFTFKIGRAHV